MSIARDRNGLQLAVGTKVRILSPAMDGSRSEGWVIRVRFPDDGDPVVEVGYRPEDPEVGWKQRHHPTRLEVILEGASAC